MRVEGRGELFARLHRHPDPRRPGRAAAARLDGLERPPVRHRLRGARRRATRSSASTTAATVAACAHRRRSRSRTPPTTPPPSCATLGLGPVIAVGYSMGGPISMLLARRHPELVTGLVVQATALAWRHTWRDRLLWRVLPIAGSWLRSQGLPPLPQPGRAEVHRASTRDEPHPVRPYIPWLVSEMSRNDPFVMVEAGRALADYDARPWASSLGVPAGEPVTTADRLVRPAPAVGAGRGPRRRRARAGCRPLRHAVAPGGVRRAHRRADRATSVSGRRPRSPRRRPASPDGSDSFSTRRFSCSIAGREVGQLLAQLVAGDRVGEHQPDAGDLAGEELGVGPGPLGDAAVELGLRAVARLLAVLGEQDQRRGVGRLQRQHERQQDEAAVPRVELDRVRAPAC